MNNFDPETAQNNEDVEHHWALKAMMHAETYFNMLTSLPKVKLTPNDDLLYSEFRASFPDLKIQDIVEDDLKSEEQKGKWRAFIDKNQHLVEDYNFGTLLRNNTLLDYGPENSFFVPRIQFAAIEIARNREGLNASLYKNEGLISHHEKIDTLEMEKEMEELKSKIISTLK